MTTRPQQSRTARSIARSQCSLARMSSWSIQMETSRARRSLAKRSAKSWSARE
jgi:hypothetical protein